MVVMIMKKIIAIVGAILIGLILIMIGVIAFFVKTIDPNSYKDKISQMVYENTGRNLSLNGTISWTVFPWLGMKVQDVALSNTAYFKDKPFAAASEVDVTIRLLPLVVGKIEVGKLVLQDFNLQLIKNSAGETNWKDLIEHANSSGSESTSSSKAPELMVKNVDIRNANITWQNQQVDKTVEIKNLNFSSSNINFGRPFAVTADFSFSALPEVSGDIQVEGMITANVANQIYALEQAQLLGSVSGKDLVGKLDFSAKVDAAADLNKQTFDLDDLNIKLAGLNVNGKINGVSVIDAPTFTGNLNIAAFDPKLLLNILGYTCGKNTKICQSMSADLTVQTTSKFLKVPKLEIKIDNTVLSGSGSYSHFDDKNVVFNVDINQVDFDSYLNGIKAIKASPQAVKATSRKAAKNQSKEQDGLYAALREIKFNGDLHVADLKFAQLRLNDLLIQVNSDNNAINLNPINFKLYQGTAQGGVAVNFKRNVPVFGVKAALSAVNLQKLFTDVLGEGKIGGVASFNTSLTTSGDNTNSLLRNLNGNGKFAINNGSLNGVDVKYQIERADALLHQKIPPKEILPSQTRFDQLTASFNITNGSLNNNDLLLRAPYCKVLGKGTANLATQILNYQMEAYGMRDNKPTDFYVPIKITGSFTNPKIFPDVAVLAGKIIKNVIEDQVHKQLGRAIGVPAAVPRGIVKTLDKLFQ